MNVSNPILLLLCCLTVVVPNTHLVAQSKTERWEGTLDVKVTTLKIQLELEFEGERFTSGKAISPDQGNAEMVIDSFDVSEDQVSFTISSVGASFVGKYSDNQNKLIGKFKQGQEFDMEFRRLDGDFSVSKHVETWAGTMQAGPQEFDFRLKFYQESNGMLSAKLDSVNEGLNGLKVELERSETECNFELKMAAATYAGKFNDAKDRIEGTWKQGETEAELNFEKTELNAKKKLNRPQHPQEPYPYAVEEVTFENIADKIKLAGTLTKPKTGGPFPAVILITGSGPQDRDEALFGHKPFLVIADHLTNNGFAVLRYDERGVGESTGDFSSATTEDFARDTEAAFEYLSKRDDIATDKIGLVGHSEGGLIAPMIAARRRDVGMIVLLAGPGVDGRQIGISQSRAMTKAAGANEEALKKQDEFMVAILNELQEKGTCSEQFVDQLAAEDPDSKKLVEATIARMESPWFKFFMQYDPQPTLKKVKCPVLVMNGKKDLQVLVDLNVDAIEVALKAGGNSKFETHKLDNLNHLFQETKGPGLMTEYGRLEETFSPTALNIMSEWLNKIAN